MALSLFVIMYIDENSSIELHMASVISQHLPSPLPVWVLSYSINHFFSPYHMPISIYIFHGFEHVAQQRITDSYLTPPTISGDSLYYRYYRQLFKKNSDILYKTTP
jgi:hypothetical protein